MGKGYPTQMRRTWFLDLGLWALMNRLDLIVEGRGQTKSYEHSTVKNFI